MIARGPDWRARLSACVDAALGRPFQWGGHDCALFAADAVLAMTDTDLAAGFRGRYRSPAGAARVLRRAGHADAVALAAAHLAEIPPALATVGDVAVVATGDGAALGLVTGPLVAVPGPAGLGFVPRTEARRAFRVPFAGEAG